MTASDQAQPIPRAEGREVEGVRFERTHATVWEVKLGDHRFVAAQRIFTGEWVVVNSPNAHHSSADATTFAHAILAAAKLATQLNGEKESK